MILSPKLNKSTEQSLVHSLVASLVAGLVAGLVTSIAKYQQLFIDFSDAKIRLIKSQCIVTNDVHDDILHMPIAIGP